MQHSCCMGFFPRQSWPMQSLQVHLRNKALSAHAVCPHKLRRVSVPAQRCSKGAGAIAGQHVQQGLWQEAAKEGALPDGHAQARGSGCLEVLCQMCDLQAATAGQSACQHHAIMLTAHTALAYLPQCCGLVHHT